MRRRSVVGDTLPNEVCAFSWLNPSSEDSKSQIGRLVRPSFVTSGRRTAPNKARMVSAHRPLAFENREMQLVTPSMVPTYMVSSPDPGIAEPVG